MSRKKKPAKPQTSGKPSNREERTAADTNTDSEERADSEEANVASEQDTSLASASSADADTTKNDKKPIGIPRVISLIVLLAVLLLIGVLFFRVMASFLVPLFLAAVLAVICTPLHDWVCGKLPRRPKLSALVTTGIVSLLFIAPLTWFGWKAFVDTKGVVATLADAEKRTEITTAVALKIESWDAWYQEKVAGYRLGGKSSEEDFEELDQSKELSTEAEALLIKESPNSSEQDPSEEDLNDEDSKKELRNDKEQRQEVSSENGSIRVRNFDLKKAITDMLYEGADNVLDFGLTGVKSLVAFAFGLGVMIFALYYFLADGPAMLEALMRLSPLDDDYERELLHQFATVSRAVVLATLITAIAQGLLAGIGYYALQFIPMGEDELGNTLKSIELPIFLLTVLTMLFSIVPFVGAMAIWVPVTVWVTFFVPGGFWPGLFLAIYCATVVSSADNVIKPFVLSGQSNLHPLLALLSVLGGVQLLGAIGILVGPMLVAFMQALLGMLRKELDDFNETGELPEIGL